MPPITAGVHRCPWCLERPGWILYVRACSCRDPEPARKCPTCHGEGWVYSWRVCDCQQLAGELEAKS